MPRFRRHAFAAAAALALAACGQGQPGQPAAPAAATGGRRTNKAPRALEEAPGGAVSDAAAPELETPRGAPLDRAVDWRPLELTSGDATVSCIPEYGELGDGVPVANLGYSAIRRAMAP